jgi:hypothetical protein
MKLTWDGPLQGRSGTDLRAVQLFADEQRHSTGACKSAASFSLARHPHEAPGAFPATILADRQANRQRRNAITRALPQNKEFHAAFR